MAIAISYLALLIVVINTSSPRFVSEKTYIYLLTINFQLKTHKTYYLANKRKA